MRTSGHQEEARATQKRQKTEKTEKRCKRQKTKKEQKVRKFGRKKATARGERGRARESVHRAAVHTCHQCLFCEDLVELEFGEEGSLVTDP